MLGNLKSQVFERTWVHLLQLFGFILIFLVAPAFFSLRSRKIEAELDQGLILVYEEKRNNFAAVQENTLRPFSEPSYREEQEAEGNRIYVLVTGYSSTTWQTDDTPFTTASGTSVRDGIVATNLLPFGTKIKIPQVYGDKVFVVEDRMHPRNSIHVDVWFSTYWEAKSFGVKRTYVEVLN